MGGSNKTTAVCCSGWNNEQLANDGCFEGNRTTIKIDFSWTVLREDKDSLAPEKVVSEDPKMICSEVFCSFGRFFKLGYPKNQWFSLKKTKTKQMITRAATGGWDDVDGCYCSLDTAQGFLQPPRKKSKAGFVLHHHSWHPFKVRDFSLDGREATSFSHIRARWFYFVCSCRFRTSMTRSELLEFLRFYMWPPGWFWGCCDPFAELLTHGFSMIRTLIEIGWNWSPKKEMVQTYWNAHIS